jgi:hypothetical protein
MAVLLISLLIVVFIVLIGHKKAPINTVAFGKSKSIGQAIFFFLSSLNMQNQDQVMLVMMAQEPPLRL